MNDERKYAELLKAIGELLSENNEKIKWQNYQIEELRKKLNEAEAEIEELKKGE